MIPGSCARDGKTKGRFGGRLGLRTNNPYRGAPSMSGSYAESISRAPSAFAAVHAFAAEAEKTITSPGMLRVEHSRT